MEHKIEMQNKTQKFIRRLYNAVSDPNIHEITWSNNNTTILIPNKENFRQKAMSKISKTKEYTAFQRSLHHYNFQRLKRADEEADEYFHKYFNKANEDNLHFVVREKDRKKGITNEINVLKNDFLFLQNNLSTLNQNFYGINEEVLHLRTKVDRQEQTINGLMEILSKIFRMGITSDTSQHALNSNLNDVSNLIRQSSKTEQSRRKIPKLEIQHIDQFADVNLAPIDYVPSPIAKVHGRNRKLKQHSMQHRFDRKKRDQTDNKKITEINAQKQINMPRLDDVNSNEDDEFQNLYF